MNRIRKFPVMLVVVTLVAVMAISLLSQADSADAASIAVQQRMDHPGSAGVILEISDNNVVVFKVAPGWDADLTLAAPNDGYAHNTGFTLSVVAPGGTDAMVTVDTPAPPLVTTVSFYEIATPALASVTGSVSGPVKNAAMATPVDGLGLVALVLMMSIGLVALVDYQLRKEVISPLGRLLVGVAGFFRRHACAVTFVNRIGSRGSAF